MQVDRSAAAHHYRVHAMWQASSLELLVRACAVGVDGEICEGDLPESPII